MINILYLHAGSEMYGADKVLLELVSNLDKKRFHPIVVLPNSGVLSKVLCEKKIEVHIVKYPILRRKYFNLKGIIKYVVNYFLGANKIYNLMKKRKVKLIHVNTLAVLEGIYLKFRLNVPLIWHVHEIIESPKIIYKATSFLVGKFSDKIVVVSKAVKVHLLESKEVPKNKIRVIYNGIDNQIFSPNNEYRYLFQEFKISEQSFRVGMIGRVNSWKGQKDFLKAMEPLLKQYSDIYAILVGGVFKGEEWRMKELQTIVRKSKYRNRIKILDFRDDVQNIHNFFDVFVLPSINPDPLPTVVLESMASGKPIVGYRHGGITEMVVDNKNGFLSAVGAPKNLSENIEKLYLNKNLRETMGKNSKKRQKQLFSLDSYITSFAALYLEMTKAK